VYIYGMIRWVNILSFDSLVKYFMFLCFYINTCESILNQFESHIISLVKESNKLTFMVSIDVLDSDRLFDLLQKHENVGIHLLDFGLEGVCQKYLGH